MTNENCLEGIRCPQCGQEDCFKITAVFPATFLLASLKVIGKETLNLVDA